MSKKNKKSPEEWDKLFKFGNVNNLTDKSKEEKNKEDNKNDEKLTKEEWDSLFKFGSVKGLESNNKSVEDDEVFEKVKDNLVEMNEELKKDIEEIDVEVEKVFEEELDESYEDEYKTEEEFAKDLEKQNTEEETVEEEKPVVKNEPVKVNYFPAFAMMFLILFLAVVCFILGTKFNKDKYAGRLENLTKTETNETSNKPVVTSTNIIDYIGGYSGTYSFKKFDKVVDNDITLYLMDDHTFLLSIDAYKENGKTIYSNEAYVGTFSLEKNLLTITSKYYYSNPSINACYYEDNSSQIVIGFNITNNKSLEYKSDKFNILLNKDENVYKLSNYPINIISDKMPTPINGTVWDKCDYVPNSYEIKTDSINNEKLDEELSKGLISILEDYNKKGEGCSLANNAKFVEAHKLLRLEKKDNKYFAYVYGIIGSAEKDVTGNAKLTCSEGSGYAFVLDKNLNLTKSVYPNNAGIFSKEDNQLFPSDLNTIFIYPDYKKQYDELLHNYKEQHNKYFE